MRHADASPIRIALAAAAAQLAKQPRWKVFFDRAEEITVELYAPIGADRQKPHNRDELYIVATGEGVFRCGDQRSVFGPGDLLYAPAHADHRFERFSEDFQCWVIFFGPPRPLTP